MRMNAIPTEAIQMEGNTIEEVTKFTYIIGSKLPTNGSFDTEIGLKCKNFKGQSSFWYVKKHLES